MWYKSIFWEVCTSQFTDIGSKEAAKHGKDKEANRTNSIGYMILSSCLPVPQKPEVVHRAIDDSYDFAAADALRGRFGRER